VVGEAPRLVGSSGPKRWSALALVIRRLDLVVDDARGGVVVVVGALGFEVQEALDRPLDVGREQLALHVDGLAEVRTSSAKVRSSASRPIRNAFVWSRSSHTTPRLSGSGRAQAASSRGRPI
jgi:hypothetical protein